MFLSLGNIVANAQVGLLFIDFESARRLRVQRVARVLPAEPGLGPPPGAKYIVQIRASQIFVNCGRYIHKLESRGLSPHVPDETGRQPFPVWKHLDLLADALPERDKAKIAEAGGLLTVESYPGENSPNGNVTVD